VDIYETKSRIAEAFVESIFRRAGYQLRAFPGDHATLRIGHEDFSPDYEATSDNGRPTLLLEVKYRTSIEQFLTLESQRRAASIFDLARRQWPALHFVLVTDRPERGRSCFQAVTPPQVGSGTVSAVDLVDLPDLAIYPRNVEDHERLLLSIFELLTRA
jgi:hypothetical protein